MKNILLLCAAMVALAAMTACGHQLEVSEYSFDGRTIVRQDWDNVMTELTYYDRAGLKIGSALFYYPGRDGWFLVDNVWDADKIYLVLCDACPKLCMFDSSQFVVLHDSSLVHDIDKTRWLRSSSNDEIPVVQNQNKEYNSQIVKTIKARKRTYEMPEWSKYPGTFWKE